MPGQLRQVKWRGTSDIYTLVQETQIYTDTRVSKKRTTLYVLHLNIKGREGRISCLYTFWGAERQVMGDTSPDSVSGKRKLMRQ